MPIRDAYAASHRFRYSGPGGLLLMVLLVWTQMAAAQEETGSAPTQSFDLGILEVSQDRWTYEQEVFLRMIREGYFTDPSELEEDRDKLVCWIHTTRRFRYKYLRCSRNGDILARKQHSEEPGKSLNEAGYGLRWESTETVVPAKLEELMTGFRGGDAFNEEFLTLVRAGERPPRKLPSDKELLQFAAASRDFDETGRNDLSDAERADITKRHDMTFHRYDHIQLILDTYASMRARLAVLESGPEGTFETETETFSPEQ